MLTRSFPLQRAPRCTVCREYGKLAAVKSSRAAASKDNIGRPYYGCSNNHKYQWLTWNDDKGITLDNPRCTCGHPSRIDCSDKSYGRTYFYSCSTKECGFTQEAEAPPVYASPRSDANELETTPPRYGRSTSDVSSYVQPNILIDV